MLAIPLEKLAYIIANAREFVGTPLLGDYLEEGASALGLSLEDFARG